jgi:hypothetical protein
MSIAEFRRISDRVLFIGDPVVVFGYHHSFTYCDGDENHKKGQNRPSEIF